MGRSSTTERARRLLGEEGGFTLIELMIGASIMSIVLIAILALLDTSARIVPQDQERGNAIQESQAGVHRMTRELRQAHAVVSGDSDTMTVRVVPQGSSTAITVTWDCGAAHPDPTESAFRRCTRTVGTGTAEVVIDRVVNGSTRPVFDYGSDAPTAAKFVKANVIVPARGDRKSGNGHKHEIVLADGFYMRNRDV